MPDQINNQINLEANPPENTTKTGVKKFLVIAVVILILLLAALTGLVLFGNFRLGAATLSWNPNIENDLAGYKIYYDISKRTADCPPGGYTNKIDLGNVTTYKIEGLENNKTYYFSITSYDQSQNESCFSEEMSKTIGKVSFIDVFGWLKSLWKK